MLSACSWAAVLSPRVTSGAPALARSSLIMRSMCWLPAWLLACGGGVGTGCGGVSVGDTERVDTVMGGGSGLPASAPCSSLWASSTVISPRSNMANMAGTVNAGVGVAAGVAVGTGVGVLVGSGVGVGTLVGVGVGACVGDGVLVGLVAGLEQESLLAGLRWMQHYSQAGWEARMLPHASRAGCRWIACTAKLRRRSGRPGPAQTPLVVRDGATCARYSRLMRSGLEWEMAPNLRLHGALVSCLQMGCRMLVPASKDGDLVDVRSDVGADLHSLRRCRREGEGFCMSHLPVSA